MEENLWNPNPGTPSQDVSQYDQSLDSSFEEPKIQDGLQAPQEPTTLAGQSEPSLDTSIASDLWSYTQEAMEQPQLPDLPEAGRPGIDYDMGHIEKIGKSLMVGMGDMFDTMGDMADFVGGTPSNEISKQIFGVETNKPISDSLHNFADYLHSYGDDVPGLQDLENIKWDDLTDINFWETGVARMIPFALSLLVPATAAARGASLLAKGAKFKKAAQAIAAGGRSVGVSSKYANTLNATRLIKTGIGLGAAGSTSNMIEGAALAGQAMNEAITQGVDPKDAKYVGRQVYVDNLASMGADIIQYGLFAGQLKVAGVLAKSLRAAAGTAKATKVGQSAGATLGKAAQIKTIKNLKAPSIKPLIKNSFKSLGIGLAQGATDGVVEQFQEVYQDWSVQRRVAEAKGEDFPSYLEFFVADEQRPTRVLSFATSLLMSGVSNTIRTSTENKAKIAGAIRDRAESHEVLDIFNGDLDEGVYRFKDKDGNIKEMNAEQATLLAKDTAARTLIMNAVTQGESEAVMEYLSAQKEAGTITEEQFNSYSDVLTEVQEAVQAYPAQNLNNKEKTELVANSWLNNTVARSLEQKREQFAQRVEEVKSLVESEKQTPEWGEKEIAGLEKAAEAALKEELAVLNATAQTIESVYAKADARIKKDKFIKEEGKQLAEIAEKEFNGETLTEEEQELVSKNKAFYESAKSTINKAQATNKASKFAGRSFKKYGKPKLQEDGSVEFIKKNKDGSVDTIIVDKSGAVKKETTRADETVNAAKEEIEQEIKTAYQKYVDTGEVSDATVKNIAYKIAHGQPLTKEEEAMRMGAKDRVEAILSKTKEEEKPKDSPPTKTRKGRVREDDKEISKIRKAYDSLKASALVAKNLAKDYSNKTFTKENLGKVIDAAERAVVKRRVKNAFPLPDGSENAVISLLSEKAADGLISINGIVDLAKRGPKFAGYAAGLGIFINPNLGNEDETFFHENFHIFRKLYSHLPEVQEMMNHIVNQPIYEQTKLDYQENILYSVPTGKKGEVVILRQEDALKVIRKQRVDEGDLGQLIATTIEDYIYLNKIEQVTKEDVQNFYEESLAILSEAGYLELAANDQTNIQDEALTKLAGLYGAYNQDMFISDPKKREAYNKSLKSWKEKISSTFTKEESEWSLEEASKGAYKKGEFDLEEKFASIKTLIEEHEAEYGPLAKESPSTVAIQALKQEELLKQIEDEVNKTRGEVIKSSKKFYKDEMPEILSEENLVDASPSEVLDAIKVAVGTSKMFRKAKIALAKSVLSKYTVGSKDYNEVEALLVSNDKQISEHVREMFLASVSQESHKALVEQSQEEIAQMELDFDSIENEENPLIALINGENSDFGQKFYMVIRDFITSERYVGDRGNAYKQKLSKAHLMYMLKQMQIKHPTEAAFVKIANEILNKNNPSTKPTTPAEINLAILGDFFTYLQSEIDVSGGNIFNNILLQFRSMTTEKSFIFTGDGDVAPVLSNNLRRQIASALVEEQGFYTEENSINIESSEKESIRYIAKFQHAIYRTNVGYKKGAHYTPSQFEVWARTKKRFNYSRALVSLVTRPGELTQDDVYNFVNEYLLSTGNQLSKEQFTDLTIDGGAMGNVSIANFFSKERLEQMMWDSVSLRVSDYIKENKSLADVQGIMKREVFDFVFAPSDVNMDALLSLESVALPIGRETELLAEFSKRVEESYNSEEYNKASIDIIGKGAKLNDMIGVESVIRNILTAKMSMEDSSYMYSITSPEGNVVNKNTRKYFLEYNKEALLEYSKKNPLGYQSLFTSEGITNPYASSILNDTFQLFSLEGALGRDRQNLTNLDVTSNDINAINIAINNKSKKYKQVIRDYSDKSRRYYADANTIFSLEEAKTKLEELRKYHHGKMKSLVDRHNNEEDIFDAFLVVDKQTLAFLEKEFGKLKRTDNYSKIGKGEINLTTDTLFTLKIDGYTYNLLDSDSMEKSEIDLINRYPEEGAAFLPVSNQLSLYNYIINKYFLQDIFGNVMQEQNFTMKNKRASGLIAPHNACFSGRVELVVFEDEELSPSQLAHTIQVMDTSKDGKVTLRDLELSGNPALMDSASYITEEHANELISKHGNIVDVKGSFKILGFGNNVDNKTISGMFGMENNNFYAKGHTIVLNSKTEGPLKNVYKALKAREEFYKNNGLASHSVIAYASSAMKKGSIKGVDGTPQNKLSLQEWAKISNSPAKINSFINSYSQDKVNNLYGYDGRFFGIQGELDKDAKSATTSKQMVSGINLFRGHDNSIVRGRANQVVSAVARAMDLQYQEQVKDLSREDLLLKDLDSDSLPIYEKALLEDGNLDMPAVRERTTKLLRSKVIKNTFKLRAQGTVSLQESDVLYGYNFKANEITQTEDGLKAMTVVKSKDGYIVTPAEAIISQHAASQLGITQKDLDGGKVVEFIATRIPSSSAGSTVVLKVKGISTKPGNTIAVHPSVSAIIGSDLDGDMLHLNYVKEGENLSKLDEAKNNIVRNIIALYKMPEVQNSLTQEIEIDTLTKAHNKELFGSTEGDKDVPNDFHPLGAHAMYGQTKGNAPMIGIIASQNLVYNYAGEGSPNLFYGGKPLAVRYKGKSYTNLDNSIKEDGSGTWYEVAKWLNLILDDGKNNVRQKFLFIKNTSNIFTMLMKMGIPPAKVSAFIKRANYVSEIYESTGLVESQYKALVGANKKDSIKKLITDTYNVDGQISFDIDSAGRAEFMAMYIALNSVSSDIFNLSHFVSLDKSFEADPLTGLVAHQKAMQALKRQTYSGEGDFAGIGNNLGVGNAFYSRNKEVNLAIINKYFSEDPYYSNGYKEGLIGSVDDTKLLNKDGILAAEENTQYLKDKKGRLVIKGGKKVIQKVHSTSIFKNHEDAEGLSDRKDVNLNMAKAMNVMRMAVHSNIDVGAGLFGIYRNAEYMLSDMYSLEVFINMTREQQYGLITQAVNTWLSNNQMVGDRPNMFVASLNSVTNNEFVMIDGRPQRIKVVRFKPNMEFIGSELDFTQQVRVIQSDFKKLPADIQNFFVAYDFLTTGWGSNGNSISPFFSQEKISKINNVSKTAQEKGSFDEDISSYMLKNKDYNWALLNNPKEDNIVNARRIAVMSYLALYGWDGNLEPNGLFKIEGETLGSSGVNTVHTIEDSHWKSDRFTLQRGDEAMTKTPLKIYSGVKETAMLAVFGEAMKKAQPQANNSMEIETDGKQYLKIPIYEYPNTDYQGVGETMSAEKYFKKSLPEGVNYKDVSEVYQQELQAKYEAYRYSVEKVKQFYEELRESGDIENANYVFDLENKEKLEAKFKEAQALFIEYSDKLTHDIVSVDVKEGAVVLPTETTKDYGNIDPLAADPLRRYLEYNFGNHIANKQMFDWGVQNGKDFLDTITEERRAKDISQLNMWLSPGDFGRGKPAIAYINKNMKLTHMAYTRNIHLITKEMNSKLKALYEANYENSTKAKAANLWLNYMPMGTRGISKRLFGNLLDERTGLRKIVDKKGNVKYRDVSDIRIKKSLVYEGGEFVGRINKNSKAYKVLNEAEKDYLEMYVKYTGFYAGLIQAKGLYGKTRGTGYIPSVTSSRWETLHKRGLFGVYYQMFRGDHDLADIMITDVNPITGESETLDYFSWKSIYMYGSDQNFTEVELEKEVERTTQKKTVSDVKRIEGLMRIKEKAKQHLKDNKDALDNKVSIDSKINDVMAMESEESMNRFNAKRSMTSAYLGTNNMHRALREYVSKFMFQHGNTYYDGKEYHHLSWAGDDREFQSIQPTREELEGDRMAFSGFEDKKQEVDAAIAQLGGGKVFEPTVQYGAGKNKNAINYLQKVVKRGLISKERNFTFSDFESEAKVTNFFVNWTMYIALGLNVPAAIGNVAIGKFNAYRQMGGTNTLLGEKRFWGISNTKGYDPQKMKKARKMIEEFGILTYRADEIAEGVGGSSLSSLIFAPMILAENWIQQAAFLGALTEEQWNSYYVDANGDLKKHEGSVGLTQLELARLERDVINVQGRGYSETDARMIQLYALSNATMQFKRWFPTFLKDRFGQEDIDDLGSLRMGSYTAAADFLTKLKDEGKQFDVTKWNKELKKLPKHQQDAVMRYWRGTHGVMIVAMLLGMSSMFMDDDEKDVAGIEFMEKLLGDMLLVVNAPKLTYMANVPALNTFKNLNLSVFHAVKGTEYSRESKYGRKGDKKYVANLAQLLPSPARLPLQRKEKKKRSLR